MDYIKLIHCTTADQVHTAVRNWSSDKSEQEHLIRSSILDMHANIEADLKHLVFEHMSTILNESANADDNLKRKEALKKTVQKMSFSDIHRLLKTCLESFGRPEFENIQKVNDTRIKAVHGEIDQVIYKGRNPFIDADCLAQLFVDCWAISKSISDFLEKMIEDPRALTKFYRESYEADHKKDGGV